MLDVSKIEVVRVVLDLAYRRRRHFIDGDRHVEVHTLVVKFKLKWGFNVVPVGFVVIELDLLIVRIFHIAKYGRQIALRRFEAFIG